MAEEYARARGRSSGVRKSLLAIALAACTACSREVAQDNVVPRLTVASLLPTTSAREPVAAAAAEELEDGSRSLETLCARANVRFPPSHPRLEVAKAARRLRLYDGARLLGTFRVALGPSPSGHKSREGDGRTPEGTYPIVTRNAKSQYRRFLGIGYPDREDARRGLRGGAITQAQADAITHAHDQKRAPPWDTPLGGTVGVHGNGSAPDWTLGCVALDDAAIDVLWDAVPLGATITILP